MDGSPGAVRLASALLEHVSCGGPLDVDRSDPGLIAVHCSGCGTRFAYTLPVLGGSSVRKGLTTASPSNPPSAADPGVEPTSQPELEGPVSIEPKDAKEGPEAKPQKPAKPPRERSRPAATKKRTWRVLVPAALAAAIAALAVVLVLGGSSKPKPRTQAPTPRASTPPEQQQSAGGNGGAGRPRGDGNRVGQGHGKRPGRERRGAPTTVALAGSVDVELPPGWKRVGTSADGGGDFAPADKRVLVAVYFESGSGLTLAGFTDRAREFVAGRHAGAQLEKATFNEPEARFESLYPHGHEYVRALIDGDTAILAIASVADDASKVRRSEALSVIVSASAG